MSPREIYLSSSSERRVDVLKKLGLKFTVLRPEVVESSVGDPKVLTVSNALSKAWSVMDKVGCGCIVSADTVVVLDDLILGKPMDEEDARRMLRMLSGRWHTVVTGLAALLVPEKLEFTAVEETRVKFKKLSDREIRFYASTGEPLGKAGGYAIQGYASLFIERIEGCYFNVIGLPVRRLYELLEKAGINLLDYIWEKQR